MDYGRKRGPGIGASLHGASKMVSGVKDMLRYLPIVTPAAAWPLTRGVILYMECLGT